MTRPTDTDVLIVGSGIMGSIVAQLLREALPTARILMVDGGSPIGEVPGLHLHDVTDVELWERYNERVASGIQGMYTGAATTSDLVDLMTAARGMFTSAAFGHTAEAMPASALAWNVGGMGVHWTAATPWPAGTEAFDDGDPDAWARDLETARRSMRVVPAAIGPTDVGEVVLDVLRRRYHGIGPAERAPQPMPMAVLPTASGPMIRTGPSVIFPPIASGGDDAFELRSGTLATAVTVEDGRVSGARLRRVSDGSESVVTAGATIVCADAVRTPQLLFASGIRPAALGRYLNEHAFITGRVLVDLDRFGLDRDALPIPRPGEFSTDSLWLPQNGPEQPFHGQIMNTTYLDDEGRRLAHSVGVSLYSPVESRPENRLVFDDETTDASGMPRLRFEFGYSPADLSLIDRAMAELQSIAEEFGAFDPATERALLAPGSSLHLTGTVRSGATDDGSSVCDPDGRVWGMSDLFLAGTGVVPTPVVANATLTGAITAVRAARAVAARLAPGIR
jgi:choline dehydrogenase-like flavoprotein